jgi:hypothetical protein
MVMKKKQIKRNKGELKLPPSSLLTMAGNKASPPNYTHRYQKKSKKGSRISSFYSRSVRRHGLTFAVG